MDFLDQMTDMKRPPVQKRPWMEKKRLELVTADMLDAVIDECIASGLYALDLETEGLQQASSAGGVGTGDPESPEQGPRSPFGDPLTYFGEPRIPRRPKP